jgi:hypothetical protein
MNGPEMGRDPVEEFLARYRQGERPATRPWDRKSERPSAG